MSIKKERIKSLQDAIKVAAISPSTKAFLEEEIDYMLFKKATGISAEKRMRDAIHFVCQESKGELQAFHFRRARSYLRMEDEKIVIELGASAKFGYVFNWLMLSALVIASLVLFSLGFLIPHQTLGQLSGYAGAGLLYLLMGIAFLFQSVPYSVAKKIGPTLQALQVVDPSNPATESGRTPVEISQDGPSILPKAGRSKRPAKASLKDVGQNPVGVTNSQLLAGQVEQ